MNFGRNCICVFGCIIPIAIIAWNCYARFVVDEYAEEFEIWQLTCHFLFLFFFTPMMTLLFLRRHKFFLIEHIAWEAIVVEFFFLLFFCFAFLSFLPLLFFLLWGRIVEVRLLYKWRKMNVEVYCLICLVIFISRENALELLCFTQNVRFISKKVLFWLVFFVFKAKYEGNSIFFFWGMHCGWLLLVWAGRCWSYLFVKAL